MTEPDESTVEVEEGTPPPEGGGDESPTSEPPSGGPAPEASSGEDESEQDEEQGPEASASVPESDQPSLEYRVYSATKAQAISSWVGATTGILALAIAGLSWVSQWQLNGQQGDINKRVIQQDEQVYASSVAIWAVPGRSESSIMSAGLDVTVQNRSAVPLFDVYVFGSAYQDGAQVDASIQLGIVAPCTSMRFRLVAPDGAEFAGSQSRSDSSGLLTLIFSETDRLWLLNRGRLGLDSPEARSAIQRAASMRLFRAIDTKSSELQNCV